MFPWSNKTLYSPLPTSCRSIMCPFRVNFILMQKNQQKQSCYYNISASNQEEKGYFGKRSSYGARNAIASRFVVNFYLKLIKIIYQQIVEIASISHTCKLS
uniref:Uncharacterized protein n=1 Tax=Micrurus surinamensis TaxID=129470 RepID=A0A2D4PJR8_MICSU